MHSLASLESAHTVVREELNHASAMVNVSQTTAQLVFAKFPPLVVHAQLQVVATTTCTVIPETALVTLLLKVTNLAVSYNPTGI